MLGINGGEFLLLLVVALVVVGPERLPRYAEQLGVWVRTARRYAASAKERVTEELGEDVGDVDWAALDPRRYDPRRIVREALLDDLPPVSAGGPASAGAAAARGSTPRGTAAGATAATAGSTTAAAGGAAHARVAAGTAAPTTAGAAAALPGASDGARTGSAAVPFDDEAT